MVLTEQQLRNLIKESVVNALIRKKIVRALCDISKGAEEEAARVAEDYVQNDKYQNNPYRGISTGFIQGVNWLSNELLKKLS